MKTPIKTILGEATEELKNLQSETVDLIISDPPYNLGKDYGNNSDHKNFEEYLEFSTNWLREAHRLLKQTGTIYVFMGVKFISYIYEIMECQLGMYLNSWITWHYTQGMGKKNGFSPRHEDILMFNKNRKFNFFLDNVRVPQKYFRERNNMAGANPGDVWTFSHVHYSSPERVNHPTQKPEALIERMILSSSQEGDLVIDPFAGSGTTLRVCQQLNRRCIGIEINPDYIEIIKERLAKEFLGFDTIDPRLERTPQNLPNRHDKQPDIFSRNSQDS